MFKSKKKVVVCIYGVGGHKAQIIRLLDKINKECDDNISFVGLTEKGGIINNLFLTCYEVPELRSKYKSNFSLFKTVISIIVHLKVSILILLKYKVKLTISTGPGIAIVPFYIFKIFNVKLVFVETWSRFEKSSFAGKFVYPIANLFLIQNKELKSVYPKSKYSGRL